MSNPSGPGPWDRQNGSTVDFSELPDSPITIKQAREAIAAAFEEDPHFRYAYQANIAMLIFDNQNPDQQSVDALKSCGVEPTPPADLSTVDGCNLIAHRIIKLIFES